MSRHFSRIYNKGAIRCIKIKQTNNKSINRILLYINVYIFLHMHSVEEELFTRTFIGFFEAIGFKRRTKEVNDETSRRGVEKEFLNLKISIFLFDI